MAPFALTLILTDQDIMSPPPQRDPDLTVLILTHDRTAFLTTSLRSVRLQTALHRIKEIIISDNGPLRLGAAVVTQFTDLPIRYIQSPTDTNFCTHVHLGIGLVETPLMAILHDDDWWHPGHLQASLAALDGNAEAGCVFSANLWLESETSTAPPLYFNFEFLLQFAQASGVEPITFDWKQVLMLTWIYTPFHMSSLVGRTDVVHQALPVWQQENFLIDRLFFAEMAHITKKPVIYLPFPSVMIRTHQSRVTSELADGLATAGRQDTVARLRVLAAASQLDLNADWREVMPRLSLGAATQLANLANECLLPEDLAAMNCVPTSIDSSWLPPAAHPFVRKWLDEQESRSSDKGVNKNRQLKHLARQLKPIVQLLTERVSAHGSCSESEIAQLNSLLIQASKSQGTVDWRATCEAYITAGQCALTLGRRKRFLRGRCISGAESKRFESFLAAASAQIG